MKEFELTWHGIVKKVAHTFRLSPGEEKQLLENRVAKLIGAIPYLADCRNPDRSSIGNVCSYLIAKHTAMKPVYSHRKSDDEDISARLRGISHFEGGNQAVIERGMNILYLTMLCNYQKDQKNDITAGKYNPVASGAWNYETMIHDLFAAIAEVHCPDMDEIFGAEQGERGFWDPLAPKEVNNLIEKQDISV